MKGVKMFKRNKKNDTMEDPVMLEMDRIVCHMRELDINSLEYMECRHDLEVLQKLVAFKHADDIHRRESIRFLKQALATAGGIALGGVVKYLVIEVLKDAIIK